MTVPLGRTEVAAVATRLGEAPDFRLRHYLRWAAAQSGSAGGATRDFGQKALFVTSVSACPALARRAIVVITSPHMCVRA